MGIRLFSSSCHPPVLAAVSGEAVSVGSPDNNQYALAAADGGLHGSQSIGGRMLSSPVISRTAVYVASYNVLVYALDTTTGDIVWVYGTNSVVFASLATSGALVFVTSYNSHLYALGITTGEPLWRYQTGDALDSRTGDRVWRSVMGRVEFSPAVDHSVVHVTSDGKYVNALNANIGELPWRSETPSKAHSATKVIGDSIYVGSPEDYLYAFDAETGVNIGQPFLTQYPNGDPLTYALGGTDRGAFAIDSRTGQLKTRLGLNYEGKPRYTVIVAVSDGRNGAITVTIDLKKVDEEGVAILSMQQPQEGTELTVAVTDPDGNVTGESWLWERSSDRTNWTSIQVAASATYTPVKGDVGNHLRVTVTYTDGEGPGESVLAMSDNPVGALPQPEPPPVTPVPGPTPVMPSKGTVITSLNGHAALSFPANSMVTPFQVRLDGEADNCTADDITGSVVQACVIVEFFEVTGNPEEDAVLDVAATLTFGLGTSKMEDLGGQSALSQDIDDGNVRLLIRYGPAGPWSDVSFGIRPDGGRRARFTATIQRPANLRW